MGKETRETPAETKWQTGTDKTECCENRRDYGQRRNRMGRKHGKWDSKTRYYAQDSRLDWCTNAQNRNGQNKGCEIRTRLWATNRGVTVNKKPKSATTKWHDRLSVNSQRNKLHTLHKGNESRQNRNLQSQIAMVKSICKCAKTESWIDQRDNAMSRNEQNTHATQQKRLWAKTKPGCWHSGIYAQHKNTTYSNSASIEICKVEKIMVKCSCDKQRRITSLWQKTKSVEGNARLGQKTTQWTVTTRNKCNLRKRKRVRTEPRELFDPTDNALNRNEHDRAAKKQTRLWENRSWQTTADNAMNRNDQGRLAAEQTRLRAKKPTKCRRANMSTTKCRRQRSNGFPKTKQNRSACAQTRLWAKAKQEHTTNKICSQETGTNKVMGRI